jgi:Fe-S-cluster containining protein
VSDSLIHITPLVGQREPMLPDAVRARLEALYAQVPGVSCSGCDQPGSCCELTDAEWDDDFAAMYPLFAVEYLNIVDYVRTHFDAERQREFLDITDERPRRCPFLTASQGCSIHPVRPMTCRTYGVLNHLEQVDAAAEAVDGEVPKNWVAMFLSTERYTVCPKTALQEPDKVHTHLASMLTLDYEREMIEMGDGVHLMDVDRQRVFERVSDKDRPTRWTWGGFNTLVQTPLPWFKQRFKSVWRASFLGE